MYCIVEQKVRKLLLSYLAELAQWRALDLSPEMWTQRYTWVEFVGCLLFPRGFLRELPVSPIHQKVATFDLIFFAQLN